ncbi:MAG: flagellar hook-associated protein FlgK, partial [Nitrospinaceae bacterium]
MTTNIFSVLNEGKQALLTHQLAIEVTGNNIANVQTPGYTRQTVNLESNTPRFIGLGQVGTGVRVESIARNFDRFIFNQLLGEGSPMGSFSTRNNSFQRLELLFNETTGPSVGSEISQFFTAFQDLAANPSGLPERTTLVAQASSLAATFNTTGQAVFQEQQNLDQVVQDTVAEINSLLTGITALNLTIHQNETTASPANDLRDQRDILVKELSGLIDITLVDEQNNQVRLTLSDGTPLVLGNRSFSLSTRPNRDNQGFQDVLISDGAGGVKDITKIVAGGELRGLLDMRDREIPAIKDKFDRLAAGLIREVNQLHQAGFGLDGGTGINFFSPLAPTVRPSVQNTGTAVVTMTNASATTSSID